ncbi:nicotinate-nicotinamide nucleotide adenylyltransferase [Vibrio sp. TH_r3]|uniref:nicotinate-nicotinamide nucleotide adenylyltransferase n=1 Tax=Vibrio sp. TH_r3 TaxID=3082084 RepID=UPI002953AAB8|nr:nicotinate-nicotinamide nucleotide adenylyltransferase [Vibrio sp. TH_r3]MDV7103432.1 nicotinate-nicotinamide nucleotide adenylyltransferase [Vibrio sp. TH_r3]
MSVKLKKQFKIAVLGSAFNPPSLGHKSIVESLLHFDQILLVPSISHAWGKTMLDFDVRCHMVELFIKDLNLAKVTLSRIEQDLYKENHNVTTFELLSELQAKQPHVEFTFIIGPDNFLNFTKFARYDEILSKWPLLVCPEKVSVRSTMIRDNLTTNASISHLTTSSIEAYLLENTLY